MIHLDPSVSMLGSEKGTILTEFFKIQESRFVWVSVKEIQKNIPIQFGQKKNGPKFPRLYGY